MGRTYERPGAVAAATGARVSVQRSAGADNPENSGLPITTQRQIERLARYAAIPPAVYAAVGADQWPPAPIHAADGGA